MFVVAAKAVQYVHYEIMNW